MAIAINEDALNSLPMRGVRVEIRFESPEDLSRQHAEFLPNQSVFVHSESQPPPFSEFDLSIELPDGKRLEDLSARLVQVVAFGNEKGLLVQIINMPEAVKEAFDSALNINVDLNLANLDLSDVELDLELPEVELDLDLDLGLEDEMSSATDEEPQKMAPEPVSGERMTWKGRRAMDEQEREEQGKPQNRLTLHEKLRNMTVVERSNLASKTRDRVTRSLLIRDTEPQVLFFMLRNPHIERGEVVEITKIPRITVQMVQLILSNKVWAQNEEIRYNLVLNPKTPLPDALKLMKSLNMKHLRELAKNWGVKTRIKQAALRIVLERGA